MNRTILNMNRYIFIACVAAFSIAATAPQNSSIEEVRMCAAETELNSCPIDNPVFDLGIKNIYVSVITDRQYIGKEFRFTWYRIDDSELFSEFLGSVYQTVQATASVDQQVDLISSFPTDVEVIPGTYEVIVHPPDGSKPVIKTFKVLD